MGSHIAIVGIALQGSIVAAVDRVVAAVGWQGDFVVVVVDWHIDVVVVVVVGLHDFVVAAVPDNAVAVVVPHTRLAALDSAHTGPVHSGHGHTDSERTGLCTVRLMVEQSGLLVVVGNVAGSLPGNAIQVVVAVDDFLDMVVVAVYLKIAAAVGKDQAILTESE